MLSARLSTFMLLLSSQEHALLIGSPWRTRVKPCGSQDLGKERMPWESRGRGNGGSARQDEGGQRTSAGKLTCVGADE